MLTTTLQCYECLNCGTPTHLVYHGQPFCSQKCHFEYRNPLIECDSCHQLFRRRIQYVCKPAQPHTGYFCSKQCYGEFLGSHHGFKVHRYNIRKVPSKYDIEKILQEAQPLVDEGQSLYQISRQLSVKSGALWQILNKVGIHTHASSAHLVYREIAKEEK